MQVTNSFFVRENTCPTCGYVTDMAGMADGSPTMPEGGDISICIKCGEILQFDRNMKLHKIKRAKAPSNGALEPRSEPELNKIKSQDPAAFLDVLKAQAVVRRMAKKKWGELAHD